MTNRTVTEKIIRGHLVEGEYKTGGEVGVRIDQTLTQDATGTLVYLQFEKLGIDRVRTEISASYVDHNLLQSDYRNADDHRFLQSAAKKWGLYFSKPGGGVAHQLHLERFGAPGKTLIGSDSHTPTGGGLGMLAIGAGGLDIALAMAGMPFYFKVPQVIGVKLTGKLSPWVSAKDVILEMLRRLSVKGGVGKVIEYYGPGVETLSATDRATIANMGAELGCTTTVFPSDARTLEFLKAQGRPECWKELSADPGAEYNEHEEIDLSALEPMIACPGSPDNVKKVSAVEGVEVAQVLAGSCANSSFRDLKIIAEALKDRKVHENVVFEVNPGSRQVLQNLADKGGVALLLKAGARIHQPGCLGCIGMGQAPATDSVSLRTFPRNFTGRSGTPNDKVYLCSPETAVAAVVFGKITDPRKLGDYPIVANPAGFITDDNIIPPATPEIAEKTGIVKGPNIVTLPDIESLPENIVGKALLKTGDNVTTDDILPAGAKILPLRSNIPAISEFTFSRLDKDFVARAKASEGAGIIIGGANYGQGSSREHAALAPAFLGVRAKITKSFARIHRSNLINFGIVPLTFENESDYEKSAQGAMVEIKGIRTAIENADVSITALIDGNEVKLNMELTAMERNIILAGGKLNYAKQLFS